MNMKKIKKFFTFARRSGGFTLVELIVVIAILAILGGVAVPAYGGYVKKANMQADISLASEVADALTLYYYSHPGEVTGGVVVLTLDGEHIVDATVGDNAMKAVFGEKWKEAVELKYDGWNGKGMMDILAGYEKEDIDNILNSTHLGNSTTESLMGAVNTLTGVASSVITKVKPENIAGNLEKLLGKEEAARINATLKEQGLENNSDAIANMVVGSVSNSIANKSANDTSNDAIEAIVNEYAYALAYAQMEGGDPAVLAKMEENLANIQMTNLVTSSDAYDMLVAGIDQETLDKYQTYWEEQDTFDTDQAAMRSLMGALSEVAGNYQDKDSLANPNLFNDPAIVAQADGYVNAVQALAGLDAATLAMLDDLPAGAIAVFISADGTVSIIPGDASIA